VPVQLVVPVDVSVSGHCVRGLWAGKLGAWRGRAPLGPRAGLSPPPLPRQPVTRDVLFRPLSRITGLAKETSCPTFPSGLTWTSCGIRPRICCTPPSAAIPMRSPGSGRFLTGSCCLPPRWSTGATTSARTRSDTWRCCGSTTAGSGCPASCRTPPRAAARSRWARRRNRHRAHRPVPGPGLGPPGLPGRLRLRPGPPGRAFRLLHGGRSAGRRPGPGTPPGLSGGSQIGSHHRPAAGQGTRPTGTSGVGPRQ